MAQGKGSGNVSTVDHPAHYNSSGCKCLGCSRPIECIDVIEGFPLNVGNAIKYLWRARRQEDRGPDRRLRKGHLVHPARALAP